MEISLYKFNMYIYVYIYLAYLEILEMPTWIARWAAIAGQLAETGAHCGPALAALVGYFAARLQHNRLLLRAIAELIIGERRQVLQVCCKQIIDHVKSQAFNIWFIKYKCCKIIRFQQHFTSFKSDYFPHTYTYILFLISASCCLPLLSFLRPLQITFAFCSFAFCILHFPLTTILALEWNLLHFIYACRFIQFY